MNYEEAYLCIASIATDPDQTMSYNGVMRAFHFLYLVIYQTNNHKDKNKQVLVKTKNTKKNTFE